MPSPTGSANLPPTIPMTGLSRPADNLPGIQDIQRVPSHLEPAHQIDGGVSELLVEQRDLVHADAVLAGACSVHREGAAHDPLIEALGLLHLGRIARVGDDDAVEVAVSHVAEQGT